MHLRLALPSVGNPPCQCSQQTSVPTHNPHGVVLDCHRARLACGRSSMCYSLLFGLSPPHTHARDTIRIICKRTVMLTIRPTDMAAPAKQFLSSNTHLPVVMFQVLSPIPVTVVIPRCCHRYHDDFACNLRTQVAGSNIAAAIPTALCRQPTHDRLWAHLRVFPLTHPDERRRRACPGNRTRSCPMSRSRTWTRPRCIALRCVNVLEHVKTCWYMSKRARMCWNVRERVGKYCNALKCVEKRCWSV